MTSAKVPRGWVEERFTNLTVRASNVKVPKAPKSCYQDKGKFPVVDQGQELVVGFVDDEELRFPGQLPVIVFGDHTRVFKYVDFSFVVGADGTQLIAPSPEHLDIRFFYYALSHLPLRNLGYSRHFKLLKEQAVRFPRSLLEQRKIAAILSSVDDAIEKTQAVIDQVKVVKRGLMQELFTRGRPGRHTRFKPSPEWRLGRVARSLESIPESWNLVPIVSVARLESGHTPSRRKPEYWEGDVPWVSLHDTALLDQPEIHDTTQTIGELGLRNSSARLLPKGTVVFSRTATIGKSTIMAREMSTTQDFANYVCGPGLHNRYLMHLFRHMQPEWKRLMAGSTHKTVYMPIFEELQILVPPVEEQQEIADIVDAHEQRMEAEQRHKERLCDLKSSLMSVLLTGELRVTPEPEAA